MVRKTIVSVSVAGLLAASSSWDAHSLGLGGIELKSGLNQPLKAEITLHALRDTALEDINVKLAPSEDFFRAGIDRALVLSHLRFRPRRKENGETVLEVTSQGPIREPFLNFLVTVAWPQGHLLREYTVLLDPPFLFEPGPSILSSAGNAANIEAPVVPSKPDAPRTQAAAPNAKSATALSRAEQVSSTYGPTRPAETLWPIAQRVRPKASITPQQMMLALQRANPDAFLHNNINSLKVGQVLQVPTEEEARRLTPAEAVQQVQRQNRAWATLLGKGSALKGPKEEPAQEREPEGEVKLLVAPKRTLSSQEKGPDADAKENSSDNNYLEAQLALTQEILETRGQQSEELQARLRELELQVKTLQQLLLAKDAQLAELEESAEAVAEEAEGQEELEFDDALTLSEEELEATTRPASEGEIPVIAPPAPVEEAEAGQPKSSEALLSEEVNEPGEVFGLPMDLKNLLLLGGGGALLLALVILRWRQRRTAEDPAPALLEQEASGEKPVDLLAKKMEKETALAPEVAAPMETPASPELAPMPTESRQVIAEADECLASGRHHKAAKMLKEALEQEPERQDLKLKLAEVYHAAGNASAFVALVEEWAPSLSEDDLLRADLVAMGRDLDPGHPLFAGVPQDDEGFQLNLEEASGDDSLDLSSWSFTADETPAALFSPAEESTSERKTSDAGGADLEFDLGEMALPEFDAPVDRFALNPTETGEEEEGMEFKLDDLSSQLEAQMGLEKTENEEEASPLSFSSELEAQEHNAGPLGLDAEVSAKASFFPEAAELAPDGMDLSEAGGEEKSEGPFAGEALMDDLDEMEVKLDLARAYIEMGDTEEARSILEEVVSTGNEQQRSTGQELLTDLAKAS